MLLYRFFVPCFLLSLQTICAVRAQEQQPLRSRIEPVVVGMVTDSATGKPLSFANASLLTLTDTSVASTALAEDGRLMLVAPKFGVYQLRISYVGYGTFLRKVNIQGRTVVGAISMGKHSQELAEVEIISRIPPVRQRGDTTEFNAGSYKTNPDATSEDLVSKMPGVSAEGGTLKANGETITQVLVDGKQFFGDDPATTLRNMPADMVDKVQVYDQKSEASRLTGFDDGNRSKTLNIVTKANKRKGLFGKASLAVGDDNRYAGSIVTNRFDGNRRITVVGQANNINQQNFQIADLVGAFGGGGTGGGGRQGGGGGGFTPRGGGFGGLGNFLVGQQGGINTTTAAGTNFSNNYLANKLEVVGNYFFNRTHNATDQNTNRTYITQADTLQRLRDRVQNRSININHRVAGRIEYKPDTNNTIVFRPRFSTQKNTTSSLTEDTTMRGEALLSTLENDSRSLSEGLNASGELVLRHRFRKMGRSLVWSNNASLNQNKNYTDRSTNTSQFSGSVQIPDSNQQKITSHTRSRTVSSGLTYTEGIGGKVLLLAQYVPEWQFRTSDRETRTVLESGQEEIDPALTNDISSTYFTENIGLGARYASTKLNYGGQVNYQRAGLSSNQTLQGQMLQVDRTFYALLPQFNLTYKATKESNLNLNINTSTNAPSASQLQTVVNTANLLSLSTGSVNLRQTYRVEGNSMYNYTNSTTARLFSVFVGGGVVEDYIGNATFLTRRDSLIDGVNLPAGGQLTRPENLGSQYNLRSFSSYAVPLKAIKTNLNLSGTYNVTSTPGKVNGALNRSASQGVGGGVSLTSNISEKLDFTLATNGTYTLVRNTLQTNGNYNFWSQTSRFVLKYIFWKDVALNSTLAHTYYAGLANGFNQNILIWNATLGKKLGKNKEWEVQLQAYDLLRQNQAVSRSVSDVYVQDSRTNILQRFFMVGVVYTLRHFNGQAAPQPDPERLERMRQRMMQQGAPPPGGM